MKRIALIVEYDGTNYCGWQIQKNGVSVQQKLEEALEKALGAKTPAVGAGRTDARVHALGQVAHFDAETDIPPDKFFLRTEYAAPRRHPHQEVLCGAGRLFTHASPPKASIINTGYGIRGKKAR